MLLNGASSTYSDFVQNTVNPQRIVMGLLPIPLPPPAPAFSTAGMLGAGPPNQLLEDAVRGYNGYAGPKLFGNLLHEFSVAQSKQVIGESDSDAPLTRQIKETAKTMVQPGMYVTTEQIYQTMLANGIVFPPATEGKPPTARITRVLSGTGLYKGHKTKGWSLKGENPAVTGSSGATELNDSLL